MGFSSKLDLYPEFLNLGPFPPFLFLLILLFSLGEFLSFEDVVHLLVLHCFKNQE